MNRSTAFITTHHADLRTAQRAVREPAVQAAVSWGTEYPQGYGRSAYYVDAAAVERARREGIDATRWLRTAVVLGPDGVLITAIRTDDVRRLRTFGRPDAHRRGRARR
jgi:hypothetical protein